jgi:hypothetical protein
MGLNKRGTILFTTAFKDVKLKIFEAINGVIYEHSIFTDRREFRRPSGIFSGGSKPNFGQVRTCHEHLLLV